MSHRTRIAITGLATVAAVVIGTATLATPAAADTAPPQVTSAGASTGDNPTDSDVTGVTPYDDDDADSKGGATPGTDKGPDGRWIAYIEIAGGFVQFEVGVFDTRKEARKAAKAATDAYNDRNNVMDGPGCDPPFVLC